MIGLSAVDAARSIVVETEQMRLFEHVMLVRAGRDVNRSAALAKVGKLVKRPVVVVGDRVLVGFDEAAYADVF